MAKGLARVSAEVTIIDKRNYHLFQPLLYQVATAALSPADIAVPIRSICSRQKNIRVVLDQITGIDMTRRHVNTESGAVHGYDYLVLATGSQYNYFSHEGWADLAPSLKSLDDALVSASGCC